MENKIQVKELDIFYREEGRGEPLVILHGWGKSSRDYSSIQKLLASNFHSYALDLPIFGHSSPPPQAWGVNDYALLVKDFTQKIGLKKFSILGHSFGGRIAIRLSSLNPEEIQKLVLTGVPVLRTSRVKRFAFVLIAKLGRLFFIIPPFSLFKKPIQKIFYWLVGEQDYDRAEGMKKKIFQKVIEYRGENDLKRIKIPTLIIWGEKDRVTPLSHASYLQKKIRDATLQIVPDCSHKLPYENPQLFCQKITDFWRERK
jgi:pimeloyl-ACP methyl ester carboxylesterase